MPSSSTSTSISTIADDSYLVISQSPVSQGTIPQIRKSTRLTKPLVWSTDYICSTVSLTSCPSTAHSITNYLSYDKLSPSHQSFLAYVSTISEPHSYHEAAADPNKKPIGCRWVYKIKHNADGSIERFKARLVAKGYTQQYEIDYEDTFSPVAKIVTVRCLLTVAAAKGWHLHQLDVTNAFLQGDLDEDIYMSIPPGFERKQGNYVCKLLKSLYGLKQASRQWNSKFSQALIHDGFTQSYDNSLFVPQQGVVITLLLLYVDDIVITGNDKAAILTLKIIFMLPLRSKI